MKKKLVLLTIFITFLSFSLFNKLYSLAPTYSFYLNPSSLAFGNITVGEDSTSSNISIINSGVEAITGITISITGTNSGQFSQTNDCSSLSPGNSCTASVTFSPSSIGVKTATLNVSCNEIVTSETASLSGTGTDLPAYSYNLSPASLDFGSVTTGTNSTDQTITITNNGSGTLGSFTISITGTDADNFSQNNDCSSISSGSSCTVTITFSPLSIGVKNATLSVSETNAGPDSASLTGTGTDTQQPPANSTITDDSSDEGGCGSLGFASTRQDRKNRTIPPFMSLIVMTMVPMSIILFIRRRRNR